MNNMGAIFEELKVVISDSERKTFFNPMDEETFMVVKSDIRLFLNSYGYTKDDIEIVVDASDVDSDIIKIVLNDKSPKGRELLSYISNQ